MLLYNLIDKPSVRICILPSFNKEKMLYNLISLSEVNRNDYRAWNGLGQAYEILGLNGYCLYYYARAAQQCPNDSRMLVALGEAFEKLDKIPNALKCYHRAYSVGDIEGMAILKLAK